MAVSENLTRLVFTFGWDGTGANGEVQETGFWLYVDPGTQTRQEALNTLCDVAVNSWIDNVPKTLFSSHVFAQTVDAYAYEDGPPPVHASGAGRAGFAPGDWRGTATQSLPPQNSVVASLLAYADGAFVPMHGRRQRGRMYLPTPGAVVLNDSGRIDGTALGQFRDAVVDLLNDIGVVASGSQFVPKILSLADQEARTMVQCRVGDVMDTQRRRRNKLVENTVLDNFDFPAVG